MAVFKTVSALLLLAGLINAQTVLLTDSGLGASCGTSIRCIAECNVGLHTDYCSTSYVSFAGSCKNYQDNPQNCRDVDNCDGWQICFSSIDGIGPVVSAYGPDHGYTWSISGCKELGIPAAPQCVPSRDNGCQTQSVTFRGGKRDEHQLIREFAS